MLKTHAITYKKCFTTLLFILFFIGLLPPNLMGQVKIKERVELERTKKVDNFNKNTSLVFSDSFISGIIMPKAGTLQVQYIWLKYINLIPEGIPDYTSLRIYFYKDDNIKIDSVLSRFIGNVSHPRNFPICPPTHRRQFDYDWPTPVVDIDSIAQGDTVKFTYYSDIPLTNEEYEFDAYSAEEIWENNQLVGWDIILGNYNDCIAEMDNQLEIIVKIKEWDLNVQIVPETVYPGDTVQVVIKKQLPDGTLVDFPATQTYEIAKLEGCMLGNILADGDSGSYFYDVSQPIYFAAADSLVGDTTGTVLLQVGLVDPEKKKELPSDHPKHIESNDCFTGNFQTDVIKDIMFNVKEIKIVIFTPQPFVNDFISTLPSMPVVICTATLNKNIQGTIKYEWKYILRQYYQRKGYPNCTRFSQSEFQGVSYSTSGGYTQWTVPFIKDSGFFWFEAVGYKDEDPLEGCSKIFRKWYDENTTIFTGGDVYISVTAEDRNGKVLAEIVELPLNKLLGLNPEIEFARTYANDDEISAIMESESKTHQFTYNPLGANYPYGYGKLNYPEYGYPNGFGIMKVDNPTATERELWNWKANIIKGKAIYTTKKQNAINYLNTYTTSYPDSIRIQESFQRYNGGPLYVYNRITKKWKIRDGIDEEREEATYNTGRKVIKKYSYGIYTWRRYQEIINRKAKS